MGLLQQIRRAVLLRPAVTLESSHISWLGQTTTVRGAKKKAAGSTTNGRGSIGRRLGIKVWHNQLAIAGNIIVRQRGAKFKVGDATVGMGKDHTIFARSDGYVKMTRHPTNKKRWFVYLLPAPAQLSMAPKVSEATKLAVEAAN